MIDPLESIIQWLTVDLTSVSGRVAGKHRFTDTWQRGQKCVSVHLDDGMPELYGEIAVARLELRLYGKTPVEIAEVWAALATLSRTKKRFTVTTSQGVALVHYFLPSSGLSVPFDDDLRMDVGVAFFTAMVAEVAVS